LVVGVSAGNQSAWTFPLYVFLTVYGVLIYFVCALLSPSDLSYYEGYKEYFFSRRKMVLRGYGRDVADLCDDYIFHFVEPIQEFRVGLFILLSLFAIRLRNEPFQAAFAVLALLSEILFYFRQFFTLA